jgi:hypothetical protein
MAQKAPKFKAPSMAFIKSIQILPLVRALGKFYKIKMITYLLLAFVYTNGRKYDTDSKMLAVYEAFMGQESDDCAKKTGFYSKIDPSFYTAATFNSNKMYLQ